MSKVDSAVNCFMSGFNCAQAVFSTYCEQLGLDSKSALKISSSFGGGMCHLGETCGAVTGAFMLIGLKFGRSKADDNEAKLKNSELVQEFSRRFISLNGSLKCSDLLGYDLSTPGGLKNAQENNSSRTICPKYIKDSAEIIDELLFK